MSEPLPQESLPKEPTAPTRDGLEARPTIDAQSEAFERLAAQERPQNIVRELWEFLSVNKKWWLLPILLMLGLMSLLIAMSATPAAPFIYTFF